MDPRGNFPSNIGTMASKIGGSKDTNECATGDGVEQVSMSLHIYEDTNFFIETNINMKWKDINDTFSGTFEEDL